MSCEESYLAIIRYLTDEREPYAPGTPGNTKRKIRKAAACYVVRNGTLFYQRRLKGQNEFTELEVVLQDSRRKELINEAHIMEGGEHLNQQLTWDYISQKYWWRGESIRSQQVSGSGHPEVSGSKHEAGSSICTQHLTCTPCTAPLCLHLEAELKCCTLWILHGYCSFYF